MWGRVEFFAIRSSICAIESVINHCAKSSLLGDVSNSDMLKKNRFEGLLVDISRVMLGHIRSEGGSVLRRSWSEFREKLIHRPCSELAEEVVKLKRSVDDFYKEHMASDDLDRNANKSVRELESLYCNRVVISWADIDFGIANSVQYWVNNAQRFRHNKELLIDKLELLTPKALKRVFLKAIDLNDEAMVAAILRKKLDHNISHSVLNMSIGIVCKRTNQKLLLYLKYFSNFSSISREIFMFAYREGGEIFDYLDLTRREVSVLMKESILRGDITNFGRLTTFSSFSHILFDDGDNAVTSLLNLAAESDGGEFIAKMRGWVILEGSNWRDTLSVSDKGVGRVIFRISDLSVDVLRSLVMKACIKDCESSFLELMKFTNFKEIDREEVIRMCREHNSSKVLGLMR